MKTYHILLIVYHYVQNRKIGGGVKKRRSVLLIADWYDWRMQKGIAKYAKEAKWHLILESAYSGQIPWGWQGDGCLTLVGSSELAEFIGNLEVPVVDMSHNYDSLPISRLYEDDVKVGQTAARHFIGLGFGHFACYRPDNRPVSKDRFDGFRNQVNEMDYECMDLNMINMCRGESTWVGRKSTLVQNLKTLPKPIGIFCIDDRFAVELIEAALDADIRVPEEVAVIGVGNLEVACECSAVPVTSVDVDPEKIGYKAAGLLDTLINGEKAPIGDVLIDIKDVVRRNSTDTLAVENPLLQRAIRFILDHFSQNISVADIAEATALSVRKLNYLFHKEFNTGPAAIIEKLRLERAKELLLKSDDKISTIAVETGFGNYLRFSRAFQRVVGVSPSKFRLNTYDNDYSSLPSHRNS